MIREITCTYIATSPTTKLLGSAYRGHATAHEPPPLNWSLAISRDDLEGGGGRRGRQVVRRGDEREIRKEEEEEKAIKTKR